MSRFYSVQIGSTWLTSDGTSGGLPCKVVVRGVESLRSNYAGQVIPSADGTPYLHTAAINNAGKFVEIRIAWIAKSTLDSIITAIQTAIGAGQTIRVQGTGNLGNFDLDCLPAYPDWLTFEGSFSNSIIQNVTLRFVSRQTHV